MKFEFTQEGPHKVDFRGHGKFEPDENFCLVNTPEGIPALEFVVGKDAPEYLQRSITAETRELPVQPGYYRLRFRMRTDLSSGFAYPRFRGSRPMAGISILSLPKPVAGLRISGQTPWQEYWLAYQCRPA